MMITFCCRPQAGNVSRNIDGRESYASSPEKLLIVSQSFAPPVLLDAPPILISLPMEEE